MIYNFIMTTHMNAYIYRGYSIYTNDDFVVDWKTDTVRVLRANSYVLKYHKCYQLNYMSL